MRSHRKIGVAVLALLLWASPATAAPITDARLKAADSEIDNWLSHGRTYREQRFSPLADIHDGNADRLGLAWYFETDTRLGLEATPLAIDGALYFTGPWSVVYAVDARNGELLWKYDPEVPRAKSVTTCCGVVNRGVAAWGDNIYVGTLDGRLIALDRGDGSVRWQQQTTDPEKPYAITGAPRVVKGKVIIGNGGSEFGVRGYVTAYDAATGEPVWRFYTVPGNPDDGFEDEAMAMAAETWSGRWWKYGGGGTVWDSIVYDPDFDQLLIGVGNGAPHNRRIRSPGGGDNLFLSSIVALDPDTGAYRWHYQEVPAETWDYTATQQITLATIDWGGRSRKVILHAPKAGFVYIIDRSSGELLSAEPYVTVTWAKHYDMKTGRPVEAPGQDYDGERAMVYPSAMGGHNWHPMAYHPRHGLLYIPVLDMGMSFDEIDPADYEHQWRHYNTGYKLSGPSFPQLWYQAILRHFPTASLLAWDPEKQEPRWRVPHPALHNGGVLATAGNLVFQGTSDGRFVAYRADSGEPLWSFDAQTSIMAGPISYRLDGEQYIAVAAGRGGALTMGTGREMPQPIPNDRLLVFRLGGDAELPPLPAADYPDPPARMQVSDRQLQRGHELYSQYCSRCHGAEAVGDGSVPDLRRLAPVWHENFERVVLDGLMEQAGMPRFDDVLNQRQARLIHAYLIERAHEDKRLREARGWWHGLKLWAADVAARVMAWLMRL